MTKSAKVSTWYSPYRFPFRHHLRNHPDHDCQEDCQVGLQIRFPYSTCHLHGCFVHHNPDSFGVSSSGFLCIVFEKSLLLQSYYTNGVKLFPCVGWYISIFIMQRVKANMKAGQDWADWQKIFIRFLKPTILLKENSRGPTSRPNQLSIMIQSTDISALHFLLAVTSDCFGAFFFGTKATTFISFPL